MIKEDTKRQIIEAASILDIVSPFVPLKKKGANYFGNCPFHNEKTASFSVSPSKNIFKCFGCGESGDPVAFLMKHEGHSFPDALRYLAGKYNITLEEQEPSQEDLLHQKLVDHLYALNSIAADFFHHRLLAPENKPVLDYALSRFTREQILEFKIGYAPDSWDALFLFFRSKGYKATDLLESKLFKPRKDGSLYDYYRNRLMFPIHSVSGRVIAFGGRTIPREVLVSRIEAKSDPAKYLNSPDTPLYLKKNILYGLNLAYRSIRSLGVVNVVEGYTDVLNLSRLSVDNTVAPCGTALTREQISLLKRYANSVVLIYDGDEAGKNAMTKNGEMFLEQGFGVSVFLLPDGEDPGTYFNKNNRACLNTEKKDYILWRSEKFLAGTAHDPMNRHKGIIEVVRLLSCFKDASLQNFYVTEISKKYKISEKQFMDLLKKDEIEKERTSINSVPDNVDPEEFSRWGFYAYKNSYHFAMKDGSSVKQSNFVMTPIFHTISNVDSRRIFEITNYKGHKIVCDFDMNEMTSIQKFKKNIEERGNFLFWGNEAMMNKLKLKLYEETKTCYEVTTLGWQKEGFWAWANGIHTNTGFIPVDEYGIVRYNHENYFIPALSNIYIADKSVFIDERKFMYKERDIAMFEWSNLFHQVFGDNAMMGFAFILSTLFRDHILHIFKNYPLLNLFGIKGGGKNQFANSLSAWFGFTQTPFNIHNGTKAGLADQVERFRNALAMIDEYKNNIEFDKVENLKAIYDAIGRTRMNMDRGKKKETTAVNSAAILLGQEMPTADVALFSRTIHLQFNKVNYTQEEKYRFNELKRMEEEGLSHFTCQILDHRDYFVKNFFRVFEHVLTEFNDLLSDENVEDRILRNWVIALAAFKTIEKKIDVSFSWKELKDFAIHGIVLQNNQIQKSNEVGMFWDIFEALFDEGHLTDKWHFRIDLNDRLKLTGHEINFGEGKKILKFKFSTLAKLYSEHTRRAGNKPLPQDSLRYYLENSKAFIGVMKSVKFHMAEYSSLEGKTIEKKQVTSAYCFDYDKLSINLERSPIEELEKINGSYGGEPQEAIAVSSGDNLPF